MIKRNTLLRGFLAILGMTWGGLSLAAGLDSHSDPLASIIFGITILLFFAIIGRYAAKLLNQPGVLGELLIGVLVGNIGYFAGLQVIVLLREGSAIFDIMKDLLAGLNLKQSVSASVPNTYYANQVIQALSGPNGVENLKIAYVVDVFSRFGVIFLLFMVGLESSIDELKHTGKESLIVAIIGVVAPMLLGFVVAYLLLPASAFSTHLFIGATLCATSVGVTARVLSELKKMNTREARTILGAAMFDDVLGLIILAVVAGIVVSGFFDAMLVVKLIVLSLVFFVGSLWLGPPILHKAVHFLRFLEPWEAKLFISFIFIMTLSWIASSVHLATIIGAFAAGVILSEDYFKQEDSRSIAHLLSPLESILAPLFFTVIGLQVKLETFANWQVLFLASGLIIAAILGKIVSGFGANAKDDRLLVGIGMLPRGEVGLVFASIGRSLGVISDELFSAVVLMVVVTTFIAPPLLKARYQKHQQESRA